MILDYAGLSNFCKRLAAQKPPAGRWRHESRFLFSNFYVFSEISGVGN
jgi:hypothetical protein